MIPVRFGYVSPATLDDAIAALAADPGARVLAGGQSLIPAMSERRVAPSALVDLRQVAGMRGITEREDGGLRIGASTTLDELAASAPVAALAAALADAALAAGDPQVRHRGTLGGSLADGHPAGDLIAAAIALDASATLLGQDGARSIAAADLVTGVHATAIGRAEILTSLDVPRPVAGSGSAYLKQRHPGSGYAICGVAALVTLAADGTVAAWRIAVTGAGTAPAGRAGQADAGSRARPDVAAVAVGAAAREAVAAYRDDRVASAEYRRHLVGVLADRAVRLAAGRAGRA